METKRGGPGGLQYDWRKGGKEEKETRRKDRAPTYCHTHLCENKEEEKREIRERRGKEGKDERRKDERWKKGRKEGSS